MEQHPTITIHHYNSSSSLHSDPEKNEGLNRQQQTKSPSLSSKSTSAQPVGSNSGTYSGAVPKQHEQHVSPTVKIRQSKNKAPVRQRSVSPPSTSGQSLTAIDSHSAKRNRRKSVCAIFAAPPTIDITTNDESSSISNFQTTEYNKTEDNAKEYSQYR